MPRDQTSWNRGEYEPLWVIRRGILDNRLVSGNRK